LIDRLLIQHVRNEIIADAFDLVRLVGVLFVELGGQSKDAALGIGRNNLDILVVFSETPRQARDGAASTGACDYGVNISGCLSPYFFCGAEFVCEGVVRI